MKWTSTNFPGVRYRQHPTRKHGVKGDRYFSIRYRIDGKQHEEGLGWASEGWSAQKAAIELGKLKAAHITGEGAVSLKEKRELASTKRRRAAIEAVSFNEVFQDYSEHTKQNKKPTSFKTEDFLFRLWIGPVIGSLTLKAISPIHIERIKKAMLGAGKAARTVNYALSVVNQLFNFAKRNGLFEGDPPTEKVQKVKHDNRKMRFLAHEEADALLEALALRSRDVHDMALLSLHCGLRAGEIFALEWADVDFKREMLTLRDTKSARTRAAFLTTETKNMLLSRVKASGLVFPARGGSRLHISKTFGRTVKELGFNDGIKDPRQQVTFHSLRHTYASWMAGEGVSLYAIKELLGHSTLKMTERYSHLCPGALREAVKVLERSLHRSKKVVTIKGRTNE